ncbi:hypothetical protein AB6809_29735 [Paraburkholderia sp. RCC_158]|uniref:hypothetical protein n=1 Tax=Paraburkholderia sp. RCC_158 TaxID=3239220 RepID=UPI0035258196
MSNAEYLAEYRKRRYAENREAMYDAIKRYRAENRERVRQSHREYHSRNREQRSENHRLYREANHERLLVANRVTSKEHYRKNPNYYWHKKQKRRAVEVQATPKWADTGRMFAIKEEAKRITEETGVPHSVDHIVPLRGINAAGELIVCGLHWEGNLQVMPLVENKAKGNRWWPDMPL